MRTVRSRHGGTYERHDSKELSRLAGQRIVDHWKANVDLSKTLIVDVSYQHDEQKFEGTFGTDAMRDATERLLVDWKRKVLKKRRHDDLP